MPLILTQETQVFYGDLKRLDIESKIEIDVIKKSLIHHNIFRLDAEKLKTDAVLEKAGWLLGSEAGENETFEPTVFTAGPTSANSKPNRIPLSGKMTAFHL